MSVNAYCYVGLGLLSVALLGWLYIRTKSARALMLFLVMVGVGYMIEFVIYILLGCYTYLPKLIAADRYYDSNLGAAVSNLLALPTVATLIAVFRGRWAMIGGAIVLFAGIESLFLKLDIYEHHWWKTWYTSVGLPFYFASARLAYRWLHRPQSGPRRWALQYLITGAALGTLQGLPIEFFSSRSYDVNWFSDPSRNTTAMSAVFYLCSSAVFVLMTQLPWRPRWRVMLLALGYWVAGIGWLHRRGIVESHAAWDVWYSVTVFLGVFLFSDELNRRLARGPGKRGAFPLEEKDGREHPR